MSGETSLSWSEIYERLSRRPERPDPLAWAALERRVQAWTDEDDVAAETCAAVLRTLNLARGGPSFEGFVMGRYMEVAREVPPAARCAARLSFDSHAPAEHDYRSAERHRSGSAMSSAGRHSRGRAPTSLPIAMERGSPGASERLAACLEELRVRNPRHHEVLRLLYADRATIAEAADALGVDVWAVSMLAARARLALAECLDRSERKDEARGVRRPGRSESGPAVRRRGQPRRRGK